MLDVEYGYIPIMINFPDEIIPNGKYRYYIKKIDGKEYICVFKIVKGKKEVFLQSFRRTNSLDIKELRKRSAR